MKNFFGDFFKRYTVVEYFVFMIFIIVPVLFYDRPTLYVTPKIIALNALLVATGLLWLYRMWTTPNLSFNSFDLLLLVFLIYQVISLSWSLNPYVAVEFLWLEILCLGLYFLIRSEMTVDTHFSGVLGGLLIVSILINTYALLQYQGIDFLTLPPDFDNLAVSTFGNKNFLAEYLIFIILIHFYFLSDSHSVLFYLVWIFSLIVSVTVLMITLSKTALLSFFVLIAGLLILYLVVYWRKIWVYRRRIVWSSAGLLAITAAVYFSSAWVPFKVNSERYYIAFGYRQQGREDSFDKRQNLQAAINNLILMNVYRMGELTSAISKSGAGENVMIRYYIWKNTLPIIREHFWFGTGLKNWQIHYFRFRGIEEKRIADHLAGAGATALDAHNEFLQITAELGITGLILVVALAGMLVVRGTKRCLTAAGHRERFTAGLFSLYIILLSFQSLTGFTMHNVFPLISLSLTAAWIMKDQKTVCSLSHARWFILILVIILCWGFYWNFRYLRRDYFNTLSQIYLSRGDLRNAEIGYRNALHYTPNDYQTNFWLAGVLIEKAQYFQRQNNLNIYQQTCMDAVSFWQKATTLHPFLERAYYNIGTVYLEFGDYLKAEHYFLKAIEIFPSYTVAYTNLGNIYAFKAIDFINANPQDSRSRLLFQKALEYHLKAVNFYQNEYSYVKDPSLLKNIGIDYHYLGMPAKAIEFYEKYLLAAPGLPENERQEILNAIEENRQTKP